MGMFEDRSAEGTPRSAEHLVACSLRSVRVKPSPGVPTPPRQTHNVILTGFMGTGKTTVGRLVARSMQLRFVDTDRVIVERHGPIPDIFATHGEAHFRTLERDTARELASKRGLLISTGGRMMLDPHNVEALEATGTIYCLVASVDEIYKRTRNPNRVRPLLDDPDPKARIAELLAERRSGYAAFTQVLTTGLTPEQVAMQICELESLAETATDATTTVESTADLSP